MFKKGDIVIANIKPETSLLHGMIGIVNDANNSDHATVQTGPDQYYFFFTDELTKIDEEPHQYQEGDIVEFLDTLAIYEEQIGELGYVLRNHDDSSPYLKIAYIDKNIGISERAEQLECVFMYPNEIELIAAA